MKACFSNSYSFFLLKTVILGLVLPLWSNNFCLGEEPDVYGGITRLRSCDVKVEVLPTGDCSGYGIKQRICHPHFHGYSSFGVCPKDGVMCINTGGMKMWQNGGGGSAAFFSSLIEQIQCHPGLSQMYSQCDGRMVLVARFTEDNRGCFERNLTMMTPEEAVCQTPFHKGLTRGIGEDFKICDLSVDSSKNRVVYSITPNGADSCDTLERVFKTEGGPSRPQPPSLTSNCTNGPTQSSPVVSNGDNKIPSLFSPKKQLSVPSVSVESVGGAGAGPGRGPNVSVKGNNKGGGGGPGGPDRAPNRNKGSSGKANAAGAGIGIVGAVGQYAVNEWLEGKAQAGDRCAQDILESQRCHNEIVNNLSMGKTADGEECGFWEGLLHMGVNAENFMGM